MPTASGSATCLGIDVAAQYLPTFSDCRRERMWSLKYEPDDPSRPRLPRLDHRRRFLHLDLMSVQSAALAGEAHERFDLAVMQETFEHIRFPYRAAAALYHLLRPGGLVLWSKPSFGLELPADHELFHQLTPSGPCESGQPRPSLRASTSFPAYAGPGARTPDWQMIGIICYSHHQAPNRDFQDYFRYTFDGARALFVDAGFRIAALAKFGDSAMSSGYNLGFGSADFTPEHLREKLVQDVPQKEGKAWWACANAEANYIASAVAAVKVGEGHRGRLGTALKMG